MGLKKYILFGFIILNSCQLLFGPEKILSFKQKLYYGDDLKLNGYYYLSYDNDHLLSIYFLNRNGVIFYAGSFNNNNWKDNGNELLRDVIESNSQQNIETCWGLFEINENCISFEKWYPAEEPNPVFIRSGYILNDTTFIITKSMRPDSTEVRDKNEIYHFKQFSPKPDSTSKFIEQQFYK